MKLLMEPIDVALQAGDKGQGAGAAGRVVREVRVPTAFCWQGRLFEVETVLEEWSARGEWWGKEDRREYFLLMTQNGVMEIFRGTSGWMLSRIFD